MVVDVVSYGIFAILRERVQGNVCRPKKKKMNRCQVAAFGLTIKTILTVKVHKSRIAGSLAKTSVHEAKDCC